jgi:hypothetical protein
VLLHAAKTYRYLLAFLEQFFFMHIILRQNISWVTLFMQEGACPITTFILARHPFQEKLAVFRPSK